VALSSAQAIIAAPGRPGTKLLDFMTVLRNDTGRMLVNFVKINVSGSLYRKGRDVSPTPLSIIS